MAEETHLRLDDEKLISDMKATAKWLFENRNSLPQTLPPEHSEAIRTAILLVMVIAKMIPAAMDAAGTLLSKMVGEGVEG